MDFLRHSFCLPLSHQRHHFFLYSSCFQKCFVIERRLEKRWWVGTEFYRVLFCFWALRGSLYRPSCCRSSPSGLTSQNFPEKNPVKLGKSPQKAIEQGEIGANLLKLDIKQNWIDFWRKSGHQLGQSSWTSSNSQVQNPVKLGKSP